MTLQDELEKLYRTVRNPLFQNYRRHPVQLRMVGIARFNMSQTEGQPGIGFITTVDRLAYRYYID